ncbi:glyoxalase/bleomycin resistance/extradiol dioxygenase family protein [Pedobacter yonginense]|uniref:Glyoxalase/bleomycin resistance/extradiol dioxygenase family protein n=1 Tax=Pedobacter yonginense TaxID=651869 RepID=A0A317ET17_9SPHI|nr:VOC family protein [Pedobacter yonginense]PWS28298.1 glyoxalase/bleomycin resistance/extradiol dioxygenase family protein [Pedobacter yonginense]
MLQGLRTIVYYVSDLDTAKEWYKKVFEIEPYFNEPYYVGYNVGGFELGLDPDDSGYSKGNQSITYWGVQDIQETFACLKALDVEIHQEPNNVGGPVWVGSIFDPFGNVIGLIENPAFSLPQ